MPLFEQSINKGAIERALADFEKGVRARHYIKQPGNDSNAAIEDCV